MSDIWMACEDCEGTTFFVSLPDGTLFCSTCHDAEDPGCPDGQMTGVAVEGDGGPIGWIGRADHLTTLADNLERYGQRNTVDGEA